VHVDRRSRDDADGPLFEIDVWRPAIEKFAAASNLTVIVYALDERVVCGPVLPTALFQTLHSEGFDPRALLECAHRCLGQSVGGRPAVVVSAHGIAVVGASLVLDNRIVGAAVAGYALADFVQRPEIERLARAARVAFQDLWAVARLQQPVPERRLMLHGELLQVLGDTLLREIHRKHQNDRAMSLHNDELERRVVDRTFELRDANESLRIEIQQRERAESETADLLQQITSAQADERRRIARDLHDQLGQRLTALRLSLASCREATTEDSTLRSQIGRAESIATLLDSDIEFLAWQLRPSQLDAGIVAALRTHAAEWANHFGIRIDFHASGFATRSLPQQVEISLYRIAQEALNNVAKHAHARRVALILEERGNDVILIVEDDGQGFDVLRRSTDGIEERLGLTGMCERAALVAGSVEVESKPTKGTTVILRIPLPA
jgi:signal transduction histidine kinase